tara:strand:+ start:848 stop:994 length:147 start_codon:yes stop_codon:yes gene_type:complete
LFPLILSDPEPAFAFAITALKAMPKLSTKDQLTSIPIVEYSPSTKLII